MKKLIFVSIFTISSLLAFDISSSLKSVGITAESIGEKLFSVVKEKKPTTAQTAKEYCTQASEYKEYVSIKDGDMMDKAINICAEKSKELIK